MALAYATVDKVYDIVPKLRGIPDLSSAQIVTFGEAAEATMNAALVKMYSLPFSDTIPLLTTIANDLTCYRLLTQRVFTGEQLKDSPWPGRFREAMDLLMKVSNGEWPLVNSAGTMIAARTDVADLKSNTSDYNPKFFDSGSDLDQIPDPDKSDAELEARNIGRDWLA